MPKQKDRPPLTFRIHDLEVNDVGFDRVMPFSPKLTNPVPTGLVETRGIDRAHGTRKTRPVCRCPATTRSPTPISRRSTASAARLSSIGQVRRTADRDFGKRDDRDARLHPRPRRQAGAAQDEVRGGHRRHQRHDRGSSTCGREDVGTRRSVTTGAITNLDGPGRHDVNLHIAIADGRIEDILALAIDSPKPLLVGDLDAREHVPAAAGQGACAEPGS